MNPINETAATTNYLSHKFGEVNCYYEVNAIGGLTPTLESMAREAVTNNFSNVCLENLSQIHHYYKQAIVAISPILGWQPTQEEIDIGAAFNRWLQASPHVLEKTALDFSHLKIRLLPPQIQHFKKLERLDLSGNLILNLLPELQKLPLKSIDISGNHTLNILPAWLAQFSEIKIKAYGIGLCYLPTGFNAAQIDCEEDLSELSIDT